MQQVRILRRHSSQFKNNYFAEICSGFEVGSYLRLIDSCVTQLRAQGPSRTCNESKEEEEEYPVPQRQNLPSQVGREREFFIDNLLVRAHFIIVMIRWTGLAPWEFEFPFPGSLTPTFLGEVGTCKKVMARFWPGPEPSFRRKSQFQAKVHLSGESHNLVSCSKTL